MAETTNAPSTGARKPAAKRVPAAKKTTPATPAENVQGIVCEPIGKTKTYAKFGFPEGTGCVGTIYAPLGTRTVKVRIES